MRRARWKWEFLTLAVVAGLASLLVSGIVLRFGGPSPTTVGIDPLAARTLLTGVLGAVAALIVLYAIYRDAE